MAVQMLKFLLSCQGDLEIRQRKLFGPKEMGSVGVGPNQSIVINKSEVHSLGHLMGTCGRKLSGKSHCGLSTWGGGLCIGR